MVIVAVLLVLPLLYALSIGPVARLADNQSIDPSWMPVLEVIYRPLEWSADLPIVGTVIIGYVGLWVPQSQPVYAPPPAANLSPAPAPAGS